MKSELEKLRSVWNQPEKANLKTELLHLKLEEIVSSVFSAGPSYYYVIDFFDMRVSHMSSSVKEIHGLEPETATFNDILSLIHPEDVDYVTKAEEKVIQFFRSEVGWDKVLKYKNSYCLRFKTSDNSYKLFLHQSIVLTLDDSGGYGKALNIHTDISHLTKTNNHKISMIGLLGEPSYLNMSLDESSDNKTPFIVEKGFTKREIEIIRLIADGKQEKEISEKLFISLTTVKTHRKNILRKSGCKNSAELVNRSLSEGWI